jgi:MYXO-CTERM domain-containing protein
MKRLTGLVGFSVLATASASAHADPASAGDDVASGITITDPNFEPSVIGVGQDPEAVAALNSPTILFVNFDAEQINGGCGNDSRNDCSTIFSGPFIPYGGDGSARASIIQATRSDVEDFGVVVLGERPPNDQPYAMVVVGVPQGGAGNGIGGIAPTIDCGNSNPWITSFAFLVNAGANTLATVIHQEAAHTWGLEHVDEGSDNLFPTAGGVLDPTYTDACHQVVADTNLNPTGANCNSIHTLFCPANQQNSYQEMLALFGPPIADLVAPTVEILAPTDGEEIDYAADFDFTFVLDDDRRPQVMDIVVYFDDIEATSAVLIDQEHSFPVTGGDPPGHGLSNGPHTIRVEAFDEAGNPATDEITIVIVNGPQGAADDSGGADGSGGDSGANDTGGGVGTAGGDEGGATADGGTGLDGGASDDGGAEGCACTSESPSSDPRGLGLLLLLAAGLRRRRR